MSVFVVTGLNWDGSTWVFGIYETRELAEAEANRIRNKWLNNENKKIAPTTCRKHAEAVKVTELAPGFKVFEIYD